VVVKDGNEEKQRREEDKYIIIYLVIIYEISYIGRIETKQGR